MEVRRSLGPVLRDNQSERKRKRVESKGRPRGEVPRGCGGVNPRL